MSISLTNYQPQTINGQLCIWLQSFGWAPAKKASEFKAGEKMLFNFGITNEVVEIKEASKQFVSVTVKGRDGKEYTSKKKKESLVAFQN